MKKLRVAVLFGGKSGEHEISLLSAASVLDAIDKTKYAVTLVGIGKDGRWLLGADARALLTGKPVKKATGRGTGLAQNPASALQVDVVFPVLHGTFGEDGTMTGAAGAGGRGLRRLGRAGLRRGDGQGRGQAAVCRRGAAAGKAGGVLRSEWHADARRCTRLIEKKLKYPVFVKPAELRVRRWGSARCMGGGAGGGDEAGGGVGPPNPH